jgi:uncharacterized protein YerC
VPNWIVVGDLVPDSLKATISEWCAATGALKQDWPARSFKDTLYSFRNKGYSDQIKINQPFVIDPSLLLRAAGEHLKVSVSENSKLGGSVSVPISQIDRKVNSESDLEVIFNDLLAVEDPISLSQIFQINERCHETSRFGKTYTAFYSLVGAPKALVSRVADRVVEIGSDIPLSDDETEDTIFEKLENFFS